MTDTSNTPLQCAVAGGSGRMGRQLLAAALDSPGLAVAAAWVGDASPQLGSAVPGWAPLAFSRLGNFARRPDVVIDFSRAEAFDGVLRWCVEHRVPMVSGTTGLDDAQRAAWQGAAASIPLLWAANFSLGIAVLSRAVALAAAALPSWDAVILEAHHAGKRDAPSGTALALGSVATRARQASAAPVAESGKAGEARDRAIEYAVTRAGDIVGEHTVLLAGSGERIELSHRATDRAIFARGALHAARWLHRQPPGLYTIDDCIG